MCATARGDIFATNAVNVFYCPNAIITIATNLNVESRTYKMLQIHSMVVNVKNVPSQDAITNVKIVEMIVTMIIVITNPTENVKM